MVFTVFDRDALTFLYDHSTNTRAIAKFVTAYANLNQTANGASILSLDDWEEAMQGIYPGPEGDSTQLFAQGKAYYADQLKPFDVTITFLNEYGNAAKMSIYGCEIINEGSGMSIDDITSEKACTFVAQGLSPLQRIAAPQPRPLPTTGTTTGT
jgi:hypothetical protein